MHAQEKKEVNIYSLKNEVDTCCFFLFFFFNRCMSDPGRREVGGWLTHRREDLHWQHIAQKRNRGALQLLIVTRRRCSCLFGQEVNANFLRAEGSQKAACPQTFRDAIHCESLKRNELIGIVRIVSSSHPMPILIKEKGTKKKKKKSK